MKGKFFLFTILFFFNSLTQTRKILVDPFPNKDKETQEDLNEVKEPVVENNDDENRKKEKSFKNIESYSQESFDSSLITPAQIKPADKETSLDRLQNLKEKDEDILQIVKTTPKKVQEFQKKEEEKNNFHQNEDKRDGNPELESIDNKNLNNKDPLASEIKQRKEKEKEKEMKKYNDDFNISKNNKYQDNTLLIATQNKISSANKILDTDKNTGSLEQENNPKMPDKLPDKINDNNDNSNIRFNINKVEKQTQNNSEIKGKVTENEKEFYKEKVDDDILKSEEVKEGIKTDSNVSDLKDSINQENDEIKQKKMEAIKHETTQETFQKHLGKDVEVKPATMNEGFGKTYAKEENPSDKQNDNPEEEMELQTIREDGFMSIFSSGYTIIFVYVLFRTNA